VNDLESALHALSDDGSGSLPRPDLADRVLARARQRGRRRGLLAATGAATVAVLITVGVSAVGQPARHRSAPGPAAATSSMSGFSKVRENVLLIGSDAGSDRTGVRPDTMIVASIDTRSGATTLVGLPRDLERVPFPAGSAQDAAYPNGYTCFRPGIGNSCILNSLWTWAETAGAKFYRGDKNPGLTATTQAAEQITGLPVDNTVVLRMKGLQELVDAVGGVDVNVRQRLPIGGNPENDQATGGWLEPGQQHLSGYQALWYARSRWSTTDYDRMGRQQCLIRALAQQVDGRKLVARFPKIAKILRSNLQTTILARDLPHWATLARKMATARLQGITLIPTNSNSPDFAKFRLTVKQALATGKPGPGSNPTPSANSAADPNREC